MNSFCLGLALSITCLGSIRGAESVYVSNFYDGTVIRIGADGSKSILAKDLGFPQGIAADGTGRVYVASGITNRVRILDADGRVSTFGNAPVCAGNTAMAFDASGRLFIANQENSGILMINAGGGGLLYVGGLNSPFGMAFDASGILYVAHMDGRRIRGAVSQVLPGGTVKVVVSDLDAPAGIAFDADGALYVSENHKGSVLKIRSDGNRSVFASGLSNPQGLSFSGNGRLLVAEYGSGKVTELSADGERVTRATGLQGPMYLAITDDAPVSLDITSQEPSSQGARLMLKGAPLSYHEIFHSSDLTVWRSLGQHQVIGGNRLVVLVPFENRESRGFYAVK